MSSYDYRAQNATMKTLIMGQVGYSVAPQLTYGAMIGQMYKGIGWYLSGRSNFQFNLTSNQSCGLGGYVGGELPFYSGDVSTSHFAANAGFMINFLEWSAKNKFNTFGMYVGGGYGKRELYWGTADGQWIKYTPDSYQGVSANIGLFGSVYGVTLNVGVSTIAFKYMEIEAGIGYMF